MKETIIVEKKKIKLKNGVLVTGLPGIGLIGRTVGRYIAEELKGEKIAELYSPYFPHQVFMTKKGGIRLIKNTIYHVKCKKRDMVILTGDVQALSSKGQYEVAGKILDYAEKIGAELVLTIGGYSTGKLNEKRRLYGVATHEEVMEWLKKNGVEFGIARGSIVGAAGLVPALAKLRNIKGACLMGETHGGYVDVKAANEMVELLARLLGFVIDTKKLETKAKEGEKILKKIEEEVQKNMITPYEPTGGSVSYIR